MLTYEWDGVPLHVDHGFPLRIYIPDRYGMKQPKWIESIEAMDHSEPGYWVTRGWSREALMRATSVIDAIALDMMVITADQRTLIPIGGIAHAGAEPANAALGADLDYLALRLAISERRAHLYRALQRRQRHPADHNAGPGKT